MAATLYDPAFAGQNFWWAVVFAILFGASNGVMTIVRGTAPAELFGQQQLGSLLGRLACPAFIAKAIVPVMFAALAAHGVSTGWAEVGLAIVAILGGLSFVARSALRNARGEGRGMRGKIRRQGLEGWRI